MAASSRQQNLSGHKTDTDIYKAVGSCFFRRAELLPKDAIVAGLGGKCSPSNTAGVRQEMSVSKPDTCMQTVSNHDKELAKRVGSIHALNSGHHLYDD